MRKGGKTLAEAAAFAIVMIIIAWLHGSIVTEGGARPLWFQLLARLVIYMLIFCAVSAIVDALFRKGRE